MKVIFSLTAAESIAMILRFLAQRKSFFSWQYWMNVYISLIINTDHWDELHLRIGNGQRTISFSRNFNVRESTIS